MAGIYSDKLAEHLAQLPSFPQPGARDLRRQAVHRLQVGLVGLGAMVMIVGLANVIMDRAQKVQANDPIEQVVAADDVPKKPVSDPLADIGVVPAADPAPAGSEAAKAPAADARRAARRQAR